MDAKRLRIYVIISVNKWFSYDVSVGSYLQIKIYLERFIHMRQSLLYKPNKLEMGV